MLDSTPKRVVHGRVGAAVDTNSITRSRPGGLLIPHVEKSPEDAERSSAATRAGRFRFQGAASARLIASGGGGGHGCRGKARGAGLRAIPKVVARSDGRKGILDAFGNRLKAERNVERRGSPEAVGDDAVAIARCRGGKSRSRRRNPGRGIQSRKRQGLRGRQTRRRLRSTRPTRGGHSGNDEERTRFRSPRRRNFGPGRLCGRGGARGLRGLDGFLGWGGQFRRKQGRFILRIGLRTSQSGTDDKSPPDSSLFRPSHPARSSRYRDFSRNEARVGVVLDPGRSACFRRPVIRGRGGRHTLNLPRPAPATPVTVLSMFHRMETRWGPLFSPDPQSADAGGEEALRD
jgi:hypothetical protein